MDAITAISDQTSALVPRLSAAGFSLAEQLPHIRSDKHARPAPAFIPILGAVAGAAQVTPDREGRARGGACRTAVVPG